MSAADRAALPAPEASILATPSPAAPPTVDPQEGTAQRTFSFVQWCFYYVNRFLVRFMWRAELPDRLPIEDGKGAVLICNHRSSVDPCVIQVVAGRRLVHWLVAQLYAPGSLITRMLEQFEIIPVGKHGNDVSPFKRAERYAAAGHLVGLLPEGTINTTDDFMRAVRPGAIVVALSARVPIVPCYIEGVPYHPVLWRPVFMRARVKLKIGEPIDLSEHYGQQRNPEVVARLTRECVKEIARLAGVDDFEPRIAGRDWKTWK